MLRTISKVSSNFETQKHLMMKGIQWSTMSRGHLTDGTDGSVGCKELTAKFGLYVQED